ncbi:hypothetical protein [Methanococcus maripaludis]|uniref:Uncharacterized protein n=1 Tax=Methanococcus maripaludis TaxID=39152 RepID=A0A2L1C8H8_METMI|nr:hypothetical protein [Methanococcus maripaludis]AVB75654.1 hypothetical protein MMJJ_02350 [Methanococcus maripaludis]
MDENVKRLENVVEKNIDYLYRDLEYTTTKYNYYDTKISNNCNLILKIYALVYGLIITAYGIVDNIELSLWILAIANIFVLNFALGIFKFGRVLCILGIDVDVILVNINMSSKKVWNYTGDLLIEFNNSLYTLVFFVTNFSIYLLIIALIISTVYLIAFSDTYISLILSDLSEFLKFLCYGLIWIFNIYSIIEINKSKQKYDIQLKKSRIKAEKFSEVFDKIRDVLHNQEPDRDEID